MNAMVGDREVECVIGKYGVSGMNRNGRKLMEKKMWVNRFMSRRIYSDNLD